MIDYSAYPHVIFTILSHADASTLAAFQRASRSLDAEVEKLFARRLSDTRLLVTSDSIKVVATEGDAYAGIHIPFSAADRPAPTLPKAMASRCALVKTARIRCNAEGLGALGILMCYMHPHTVELWGPYGGIGRDWKAKPVPIHAQVVVMHWQLLRSANFQYAIYADKAIHVNLLGPLPPTSSRTLIKWFPPLRRIFPGPGDSVVVNFTHVTPPQTEDLSHNDYLDFLIHLATLIYKTTSIDLVAPHPLTDHINLVIGDGPPRSTGTTLPQKILDHLEATLAVFIEQNSLLPLTPAQIDSRVREAMRRLRVYEAEEWDLRGGL